MKTVGEILVEARKKKGIEIAAIAKATKIRPRFIRAIEKNEFGRLPSASTAYGFIKNYADFLGVTSKFVLAVFRRDFCQDKEGKIVPRGLVKPLDVPRIFQSPRTGLFLATGIFIIGILFYLSFQYFSLIRGPILEVDTPLEQARILLASVEVMGRTEPDATVTVGGELTTVSPKGEFKLIVNLAEGENIIVIEATNKLGKTKKLIRRVFRE